MSRVKIAKNLEFEFNKTWGRFVLNDQTNSSVSNSTSLGYTEATYIWNYKNPNTNTYIKYAKISEKPSLYKDALLAGVSEGYISNDLALAAVRMIEYATMKKVPTIDNVEIDKDSAINAINDLIDFFSEFNFEPNFRFINTIANNKKVAANYVCNYFELSDNQEAQNIKNKVNSDEFKDIVSRLPEARHSINNRLKVYYGSQGTGKTTKAMKEADGRVIICNSSMLPADLIEDFDFKDGKPTFKQSVLQSCMESGQTLVLDEINLLPYETLRFLQGLLDGKKEFTYKNRTINIADGFNIIGTMNLVVGNIIQSLPEPLVDRCSEIKKFKLTANDLLEALL